MRKSFVLATALLLCGAVSTSAKADYTVRAKGRMVYKDGSTYKPLANARVQLMDSDSDFDEVMKRGKTNDNGEYDLTGQAEDDFTVCDGCDRPDPYIKTILYEANRIDIHNIWGFTHFGVTPTKEDKSGTIQFGEWHFESDEKLYPKLFAYVTKQYDNFTRQSGDERVPGNDGVVGVVVPEVLEGGVPWTGVDALHWPGDYDDATTVFHEFGHRIRHAADGGEAHFLGDAMLFRYARNHSLTDHTNLGFAFNEGWAEYHSTMLNEEDRETIRTWEMRPHGDEVEGNVAAKLYKLSAACGGFKNMWAALKAGDNKDIPGGPAGAQSGIHSFAQFHTFFKQRFPNCIENLKFPILRVTDKLAGLRPRSIQLTQQTAALTRLLDGLDARAPQAKRIKWSAARLARVPAGIRPGFKRLVDKRQAMAEAHEARVRSEMRTLLKNLKPASETMIRDGSHAKNLGVLREAFLKATGEPRMRQIAEIVAELKKERGLTKDARFQKYIDRLLRRYALQEAEIRAALQAPTGRIPDVLIPPSLGAAMAQ